jgi:NAD(P)-dependent dehydrogenase (short-subunit alcohol dehydrogenase family)
MGDADNKQSFLDGRAALAGKVALVAGGGGGLGRAVALDFARAGMHLAICDRDEDALESTANEARKIGATVADSMLDVRDSGELERFFEFADAAFDSLDILVNVVGGTFRSDFVDVNAKGVDTLIRTNFTWVTEAIQLAATRMAKTGGGSIMTITSIEAHRAAPRYAVYAAMKAAVTHLSKILAVELGPAGIRVNCIAPDIVPTVGMGRLMGAGGRDADDPVDAVQIPLARRAGPRTSGTARSSWRRRCRRTSRGRPFTPTAAPWPRPGGCSGPEPDGPLVLLPGRSPRSVVTKGCETRKTQCRS